MELTGFRGFAKFGEDPWGCSSAGEHCLRKAGAGGSNPLISTMLKSASGRCRKDPGGCGRPNSSIPDRKVARESKIKRQTSETQVEVRLQLDGTGTSEVSTGIHFLDHMLEQLARHGWFDLEVRARGDLEVDFHHTVEDVGICLGKAIKEALGDGSCIRRFAHAQVPMDESLVGVSLDLSGRPYLACSLPKGIEPSGIFPVGLLEEFFRALSVHGGITLHINGLRGKDPHHLMEATFKAFGRALAEAVALEPRSRGVPSTKGIVD